MATMKDHDPVKIHRATVDGADYEVFGDSEDFGAIMQAIAIDPGSKKLYVSPHHLEAYKPGAAPGGMQVLSADGTTVETYTQKPWYVVDIEVDTANGHVYYSGHSGFTGIRRMDLDGSNDVAINTEAFNGFITLDVEAGKIYYGENVWTDSSSGKTIYSCDLDGSNIETVVENTGGKFYDIDLFNNRLYLNTKDNDVDGNFIRSYDIASGTFETLFEADGDPTSKDDVFYDIAIYGVGHNPPTFYPIADLELEENASSQTVHLTGITDGDGGDQGLRVTATSNNPGLIGDLTITYQSPNNSGTLAFTPTADETGTAIITVTVEDGGLDLSLATRGDNLTFSRSFVVVVEAADHPPTLDPIEDLEIDEDAPTQTVDLTGITDGDGGDQGLRVSASSSNPGLVPDLLVDYTSPETTGLLTFTPVAGESGESIITATVEDGGKDQNLATTSDNLTFSRTFNVTVGAVNDLPTLNPLEDLEILEDAATQTVDLSGITDGDDGNQGLSVTAISSNPGLILDPSVDYTSPDTSGTLSFEPLPNQFGSTLITVTVEDGGLDLDLATKEDNLSFSRTFEITVGPVNDARTLDPIPDLVIESGSPEQTIDLTGITDGDGEGSNQPLAISGRSTNPSLTGPFQVVYTSPDTTGSLLFTPIPGRCGITQITVTVEDGGLDLDLTTKEDNLSFSRTFELEVYSRKRSFITADQTIYGQLEGTYRDTYWKNSYSQNLQEVPFKQNQRSRLEHHWELDFLGGEVLTEFFVHASHDSTNEQFRFEYQVEGSSTWKTLVTTTQNGGRQYQAILNDPDLANDGKIKVRVVDTDREDDAELAKLNVNRLFFQSRRLSCTDDVMNILVFDPEGAEGGGNKAQFRFYLADRNRQNQDIEVFSRSVERLTIPTTGKSFAVPRSSRQAT
ncbi:MAG: Ig-like domain-containing protein [Planctomycetota bacterium]|nr:Ig-like domain-containing protein [Planctomycetota bacterium]